MASPAKHSARGAAILRGIALGIPALVATVIVWDRLTEGTTMHQDEPAWIASAYYFDLLLRGEMGHPDWRLLPARESPFVGKFLFGATLWATGHPVRSFAPLAAWHESWLILDKRAWGEGRARAEREAVSRRLPPQAREAIVLGRYPFTSEEQLAPTRWLVGAFGIVCAAAVAALGQRCRGPMTGLLAGVIVALHPVAVHSSTHALFDMIALAFSALAMLTLIALVRPAWGELFGLRRTLALSLLSGALLALAVGTKMNALVVVLVAVELALILVLRAVRFRDRSALVLALALGLSLAVGFGLFLAINPALYGDVSGGLRDLFGIPARNAQVHARFLPDHLARPAAKLRGASDLACFHPAGLLVVAVVTLWPTWEGLRRLSARTVVVLWWWTALGAVIAWIPFPWPRYVLPLLPPAAILVADAIVGLVAGIRAFVSSPRRPTAGAPDVALRP